MSGGAGYVLSREALRRFAVDGLDGGHCLKNDSAVYEDVEMGRCMEKIGVVTGDSRDEFGQGRFFVDTVSFHVSPGHMNKVSAQKPGKQPPLFSLTQFALKIRDLLVISDGFLVCKVYVVRRKGLGRMLLRFRHIIPLRR